MDDRLAALTQRWIMRASRSRAVRQRPGRGALAQARSSPASASSDRRCPSRYPPAPAPCSPTPPPCRLEGACCSARGFNADRHANPLMSFDSGGSKLHAEQQHEARQPAAPQLRHASGGSRKNPPESPSVWGRTCGPPHHTRSGERRHVGHAPGPSEVATRSQLGSKQVRRLIKSAFFLITLLSMNEVYRYYTMG